MTKLLDMMLGFLLSPGAMMFAAVAAAAVWRALVLQGRNELLAAAVEVAQQQAAEEAAAAQAARAAHAVTYAEAQDVIDALQQRNRRQAAQLARHAMDAMRRRDVTDPETVAYALQEAVARKAAGAALCERN